MSVLDSIIRWINDNILWGVPMVVLILVTGILLTIRSRCLQVTKFKSVMKGTLGKSIKQMTAKEGKAKAEKDKNAISPFEAFSTAVSGTIGTGNIIGVTTAILSGGPGAVLWMWVSAFFGCVTKYSEITLGMYYRKKDEQGEFIGGPMYYIEHGAKSKFLAYLFAIFALLATLGMSFVQAGTIQNTLNEAYNIPTYVTAIVIAVITGIVLIGGIKRIGRVASILVPFMAILFLLVAIITIFANVTAVPIAFASIFSSAFTVKSAVGGFLGYGIAQAMRFGFARGVFSNEAGLGSSVMAHTTSTTKEPVEHGFWGVFEVFFVTFIICTLTALMFLTSGIDGNKLGGANNNGDVVAMAAFSSVLGGVGKVMFTIILPLFAFTSILGWAVYGEKATEYLFKKHQKTSKLIYNIIYVLAIVGIALVTYFNKDSLGARFVWDIADMTNGLMALPNLIGLVILSGQVVKITKNYFDRKKGLNVKPMISAYENLDLDDDKE